MAVDADKEVYKEAITAVEFLVAEVIERCEDVANDNHFETVWVLEQFRNKFNQTLRQGKDK